MLFESDAARFREIVAGYYSAWLRYHPEAAVDAGVEGYDHLLTPYSEEPMGALACLNDELRTSLEEIDYDKLDEDGALDYQLLYGAAMLENQRLLDVEPRRPDPERLLPVNAIYQLTVRPVADFSAALLARLRAVPDHLDGARWFLHDRAANIPLPWLQAAVTSARQGQVFLGGLPAHPKVTEAGATGPEFAQALQQAGEALAAYGEFLQRELGAGAGGDIACGRSYFDHLLRYRHFLDIDADALHRLGATLVEQCRAELKTACRVLTGNEDIAGALRQIRAHRPPPRELLAVYRRQMQAAREFLAARRLVSLPAPARLEVVETPGFLRHRIPFAAYHEPAPRDPDQRGYYFVTPLQTDEERAQHPVDGIAHTCVHEAWPGHHLQFVTAHLTPAARSLPRLLNPSSTLYEGWALYCEQLMHEQGFLHGPEHDFLLSRDRLWRALRIVIDVELHTRGLTLEAGAQRLVSELGFAQNQARGELLWYSQSPAVPMGYATGWTLINALREGEQAREAQSFDLNAFHDRLLSAGSIALPLVIERCFGKQVWEQTGNRVFGEARHATT